MPHSSPSTHSSDNSSLLTISKPLLHGSDLPQMRLLNELRFRGDVPDAVAVPMMATAGDQILRVEVG